MGGNSQAFLGGMKIIKRGLFLPVILGFIAGMIHYNNVRMRPKIFSPASVGAGAGLLVLTILGLATLVLILVYWISHRGLISPSSPQKISKFAKAAWTVLLLSLFLCIPLGAIIFCISCGIFLGEEVLAALVLLIPAIFVLGGVIGIILSIFSVSEIIASEGKIGGIGKTVAVLIISLTPDVILFIWLVFALGLSRLAPL